MAAATRSLASAIVGSLLVVGSSTLAFGQGDRGPAPPAAHSASAPSGSLGGVVRDERGAPVAGAVVSALGAATTVAISDDRGRFEFTALTPGPYLVRAHLEGYVAARAQRVKVGPNARATSNIALRVAGTLPPVLAAGFVGAETSDPAASRSTPPESASSETAGETDSAETAWRMRHMRRSILKDVAIGEALLADGETAQAGSKALEPVDLFGRMVGGPSRAATGFFIDTDFTGQINLLTTGSFDSPQQLFSPDTLSRNVAYIKVGAPVGEQGDWTVRGALNQADISSWIVAGSYVTRPGGDRHRYEFGLSYSTQRYDGGNLLTLRDLPEGSRNVGTVYGYDRFVISPTVALSYGATYGHYDYLSASDLLSPRVELTLTPVDAFRLTASAGRRELAPGAEEFLPPGDSGVWLPPQRTFSSLAPGESFKAERTAHIQVGAERDFGASTLTVRAFRQHVDDQLATLFGTDVPGLPTAKLGHYVVANVGDVEATGYAAGLRTLIASRINGSVEYSMANTRLTPVDGLGYLLVAAPSVARTTGGRVHSLSTRLETDVQETSTRVLLLYRVSNGQPHSSPSRDGARPGLEGRFDVQVRQSLPFMNFSSARWEMLLAVRNFFREAAAEESVYDEIFAVRPPKRVVGGVTLRF